MSASVSPVCGRAYTILSILTASTLPSERTGSPVNGDTSGWATGTAVVDRVGVGWAVGGACAAAGLAARTAIIVPIDAIAATAVTATATATMILFLMCNMAYSVTGSGSRRSGRSRRS